MSKKFRSRDSVCVLATGNNLRQRWAKITHGLEDKLIRDSMQLDDLYKEN